jgi:beta-mannosidase
LVTFLATGGGIELRVINDSAEYWTEQLDLSLRDINGRVLALTAVPLDVPPRSVARVELPGVLSSLVAPDGAIAITADSTAGRASWFYAEDVEGRLAEPNFEATVDRVDGGYIVRITARTLLRDIALLADRAAADAIADTSLITLCDGETAAITVRTDSHLTVEQLTSPLVLRSANQLVAAARSS